MTDDEAYTKIVEPWLRDNRVDITFPKDSISDLCKRIAKEESEHYTADTIIFESY